MTHDPHSGDWGLGFFGHALESGSYYVVSAELGELCFLCDAVHHTTTTQHSAVPPQVTTPRGGRNTTGDTSYESPTANKRTTQGVSTNYQTAQGVVVITPTDSFHTKLFIEPLSLYVAFEAGTMASVALDLAAKTAVVTMQADTASSFTSTRVRLVKTSTARPGTGFNVKGAAFVRGAYETAASQGVLTITWV
jgi:hypothetical protein